jgi:phage/plasmid primase-like uncharacterized protein
MWVGAELVGPCPRCGGRDRFQISLRKRLFLCRGTAAGDVIDLVRHIDDCSFAAAVETLTGQERPAVRVVPAPARPKTNEDYGLRT